MLLLVSEHKEKKRSFDYTAAGLFEGPEVTEEETSTLFNTKMNALSSRAKLAVLSVHLGNAAANASFGTSYTSLGWPSKCNACFTTEPKKSGGWEIDKPEEG